MAFIGLKRKKEETFVYDKEKPSTYIIEIIQTDVDKLHVRFINMLQNERDEIRLLNSLMDMLPERKNDVIREIEIKRVKYGTITN